MSLRKARDLDAKAQADGRPTPWEAQAVLLAADAAEYRRLEAERTKVYDRIRTRSLRAHHKLDAEGRGLPERHDARFSLDDLSDVTKFHRNTIKHWLEDLVLGPMIRVEGKPQRDTTRARPDLLPVYTLPDDEDAVRGAAG
jgi:hypothetical protein